MNRWQALPPCERGLIVMYDLINILSITKTQFLVAGVVSSG